MKKIITSLAVFTILAMTFLIGGCGPVYKTHYTYVPPKSYRARMCLNQCLSDKSSCNLNCRSLNQRCHSDADRAARPGYRAYVRKQRKNNKPIWRNISDFADYSGCRSGCSCSTDYRQCYTNCGGQVIASTVCTAFCKKATP